MATRKPSPYVVSHSKEGFANPLRFRMKHVRWRWITSTILATGYPSPMFLVKGLNLFLLNRLLSPICFFSTVSSPPFVSKSMAEISGKPEMEIEVPRRPPGFERRVRRSVGTPFRLRGFDVPRMRHAPRTRQSDNRRFRLPFRFSEWIRSDSVSMTLPDEFLEVYWEPRCANSTFRLVDTGETYPVTVDIDERGRCVFGGGFPDVVYAIGFEGEARLDFAYMGRGRFEVKIGGDCEEGFNEYRYLQWTLAWERVRRVLG